MVEKLSNDIDKHKRIMNTYQLVGLYLMLMGEAEDGQVLSVAETNQLFSNRDWHGNI
jgi:hypothetical protein